MMPIDENKQSFGAMRIDWKLFILRGNITQGAWIKLSFYICRILIPFLIFYVIGLLADISPLIKAVSSVFEILIYIIGLLTVVLITYYLWSESKQLLSIAHNRDAHVRIFSFFASRVLHVWGIISFLANFLLAIGIFHLSNWGVSSALPIVKETSFLASKMYCGNSVLWGGMILLIAPLYYVLYSFLGKFFESAIEIWLRKGVTAEDTSEFE